jgi:DNA uptake protein ComE-like DNA-binding protein
MTWKKTPENTGAALLLLLAITGLYGIGNMSRSPDQPPFPEKERAFVEFAGVVANPGVYEFSRRPDFDRLAAKAGCGAGFSRSAFSPDVRFPSGTQVRVEHGDGQPLIRIGQMNAFYKMTLKIPISLNHEDGDGLTALPGIGPRLAEAIVRNRAARNGFTVVEDLLSVPGFTQRLYNKIRPYVKP